MDVAIVAPCPVPYERGGAENLFQGLQQYINDQTEHQAELFKLPSHEFEFWALVDSYRRFSELDLAGFDVVVSTKYPAWMTRHPRHVVYMQHKLRGLYDTYHFTGLPLEYPDAPAPVRDWRDFAEANHARRDALDEHVARLPALRDDASLPPDLFAFPGPFIREVLHALDAIGLAPSEIHRYGAIAAQVRAREGYFPEGADVFVAYHPTALSIVPGRGRGDHIFTACRLDNAKRVHLLVEAMRHVGNDVPLRIAGDGPEAARLRAQVVGDKRVTFLGRIAERELIEQYRSARAVAYVPYAEDYGLVTVEAFLAGRPVVTAADSGGTNELVEHDVTGLIVDPDPEAIAAGLDELWTASPRRLRGMGRAARETAAQITWEAVLTELLA